MQIHRLDVKIGPLHPQRFSLKQGPPKETSFWLVYSRLLHPEFFVSPSYSFAS